MVIGSSDQATTFSSALSRRGLRFVSCMPSVAQLRRHLVLGEDVSLLVCVLLGVDELLQTERVRITRMLADRQGFPTRIFCVGVLGESQSLCEVGSVGCDAYVRDTAGAIDVIRAVVRAQGRSVPTFTAQQLMRSLPDGAGRPAPRRVALQSAFRGQSRAQLARPAIEPSGGDRAPT
jgi:hypothetical protein